MLPADCSSETLVRLFGTFTGSDDGTAKAAVQLQQLCSHEIDQE